MTTQHPDLPAPTPTSRPSAQAELQQVAPLTRFRHVTVLTGAGISVASGLPTYRGAGGMYTDQALEAAMDAAALPDSLPVVWDVWGRVHRAAAAAGPNAGHRALSDVERHLGHVGGSLTVITTNVDGLHTAAGSSHVLELHGRAGSARCLREWACRASTPVAADFTVPPPCRACGGPTRPDIVLFGESLPAAAFAAAQRAASGSDLFLSVGSSGSVWPANELVMHARDGGALCVSLTAEPPLGRSHFHHQLLGDANTELPAWAATA